MYQNYSNFLQLFLCLDTDIFQSFQLVISLLCDKKASLNYFGSFGEPGEP
jgi:hypothetical protein